MRRLTRVVHEIVIAIIRKSPAQSFLFRAYHRLVREMNKSGAIAETSFGGKLHCDPTDLIQSMIFHFGIWEPEISHVSQLLVQPGDVVADVGANVGYDTLLFSKLVGAGGRVIAIEAMPDTFDKLGLNLSLNGSPDNVRRVNKAVSDETGSLVLYTGNQFNVGAAGMMASSERPIAKTVEALPLDRILTDDERGKLKLIKMDIEGGERPVLQRFLRTMEMYSPEVCLLVEASPQFDRQAWVDIFDQLKEAGFSAYGIENSYAATWYLNWDGPKPPVQLHLMPEVQTDILFMRGELRWSTIST